MKQKHPEAVILSAPMAITLEHIDYAGNLNELDYWTQMYQAGAKPYFDIMAANAYGLDLPPSDPPSKDKLNFRRVELLRDIMVQNDDSNKAIWFNEYGWNASPTTLSQDQQLRWRRVDPAVQARYTVDGIQYALDNWPWAGVFFIWYFRQVGDIQPDSAEYYFRMVNPDFTTEPVYDAVQTAAAQYSGPGAPPTATAAPAAPTATATAAAAPPTDTAAPAAPTDTAAAAPPTATVAPAAVTATTTGVVAATPVPPAAASSGDATIWFIAGGILVLAGIAAIGLYLARRPSAG